MHITQAIHHPLGVTAFGSHIIGVDPDRATIAFSVIHVADRPDEAYGQVDELCAAVTSVFATYNLPAAAITTSHVSMQLATDGYGKDRRVLGYRGEVDYVVMTSDLPSVSALVMDLVRAGARAITSVRYTTSRLRELRAVARERAFASARIKAEGYARAAGLRLGRALHIEDVDPSSLSTGHGADADLTGSDEHDTTSGSITVKGAVSVCFALVD